MPPNTRSTSLRLPSRCTWAPRPRASTSRVDLLAKWAVARDDEVQRGRPAGAAPPARRGRGPGASGRSGARPIRSGRRRARGRARAGARPPPRPRSMPTKRSCVAEVRDRPDRAAEPQPVQLGREVVGQHDGRVDAADHGSPPRPAHRTPDLRREAEDALPHERGAPVPARSDRGFDRPAPVREHDVDGRAREVATECARAEHERPQAAVRPVRQCGEVGIGAAVESELERDGRGSRDRSASRPRASSSATSSAPRRWLRATRCRIRKPASFHGRLHAPLPAGRFAVVSRFMGRLHVAPSERAGIVGRDGTSARCDPRAAHRGRRSAGSGRRVGEHRGLGDRARRARSARPWIVTPAGVVSPEDARRRASRPELAPPGAAGWRRRVPVVVKTAVKDARDWRRARGFRIAPPSRGRRQDVAFVWQRHELFHTAGLDLARVARGPERAVRSRAARVAGAAMGRAPARLGRTARTGGGGGAARARRRRRVRIGHRRRAGRPARRRRAPHRHHADRRRSRPPHGTG